MMPQVHLWIWCLISGGKHSRRCFQQGLQTSIFILVRIQWVWLDYSSDGFAIWSIFLRSPPHSSFWRNPFHTSAPTVFMKVYSDLIQCNWADIGSVLVSINLPIRLVTQIYAVSLGECSNIEVSTLGIPIPTVEYL